MKYIPPLFVLIAFMATLPAANADVLLLDAISNAPQNTMTGLPRPTNGQSMQTVRARFGDPRQELPQVGDPPITRWVYDGYTVYFEFDKVITSVVHR